MDISVISEVLEIIENSAALFYWNAVSEISEAAWVYFM